MNQVILTQLYLNKCPCGRSLAMKAYGLLAMEGPANRLEDPIEELIIGLCKCGNVFLLEKEKEEDQSDKAKDIGRRPASTGEKMTCPRRGEDGTDDPDSVFKMSGRGLDSYRDDNTCSYCGSFNPNTLMERLEAGDIELVPTDKSYKAYVENMGGNLFRQTYRSCPPDAKCAGPDDCAHWVTRERPSTKFYFQHLSTEQKKRFIELLNEKKINIGAPGHFYVRPFFIAP